MKTNAVRSIFLGTICTSILGASAIAPAADWHDQGPRDHAIVRHDDSGLAIGLGLGLVVGALLLDHPRHHEVCVEPVVDRRVIIDRDYRRDDRRRDDRRSDRRDDRKGGWR